MTSENSYLPDSSSPVKLTLGDCLATLKTLPDNSIHAIVTDPPYHLTYGSESAGFMGKAWDGGNIAFRAELWREVFRVLKPGGHLLSFGGTRTYHRLACAIEDAGFEIRDSLHWIYGCLSDDTEVLVDGRWVHYREATTGRLALCYDVANDSYRWQPIQQLYIYPYADTAYKLHSGSTDQIVSRNHRCLVERDGRWAFVPAEEAAREHQVRVPILEDVCWLQDALLVPQPDSSPSEQVLSSVFEGNPRQTQGQKASARTPRVGGDCLCGVWHEGMEAPSMDEAHSPTNVLPSVQREASWKGMGETRSQGTCRLESGIGISCTGADDRTEQSCMEGRGDDFPQTWKLSGGALCPVPGGVSRYGPRGWIRHGAQAEGGRSFRQASHTDGSGTPLESRSIGQQVGKSGAFCVQPGPQAFRGPRFTSSTLARIEPMYYEGTVWCIQVPTGAFVARRNGKVFVTGNSGFPKSLDVSKAIDKKLGAAREVLGAGPYANRGRRTDNQVYGESTPSEQEVVTAPATPEAVRWSGYGTALKPAHEPIVLARKPLDGTVAENVLTHEAGGLHIDASRIFCAGGSPAAQRRASARKTGNAPVSDRSAAEAQAEGKWERRGSADVYTAERDNEKLGRWPANVLLSHSAECICEGTRTVKTGRAYEPRAGQDQRHTVFGDRKTLGRECGYGDSTGRETVENWKCVEGCPVRELDLQGEERGVHSAGGARSGSATPRPKEHNPSAYEIASSTGIMHRFGDSGGPSRFFQVFPPETAVPFFYCAKASKRDRGSENKHPTVKPTALMRYLVRLVTPEGGIVLDPFMGSGTTGVAARMEGFLFVGMEQEPEYFQYAEERIAKAS